MDEEVKKKPIISFFEDFGLMILSITLFLGGVYILALKIAFWSLFLGIASIQIGIVLIILAFDALIKRKTKPITEDYQSLNCLVCRKNTFVPKYQTVAICDECKVRVANTFKAAVFTVFTLVTLTAALGLVKQNQDFRRRAAEKGNLVCEAGEWEPNECQCGVWEATACESGEFARLCSDGRNYCCQQEDSGKWKCFTPTPK